VYFMQKSSPVSCCGVGLTILRGGASNFFACLPRPFLKPKELASRAAASLWQRCRGQSVRKEIMCCNAGSLAPWDTEIEVAAEVGAAIKRMERTGDLLAEWKDQMLRSIVTCQRKHTMHWRRVCQCITLSWLFGMLVQDYSADLLYHFYRTQRIVVDND
jgi:hypothetical protein